MFKLWILEPRNDTTYPEAVLARGPSSAVVCAAAAPARDVTGSPRSVLQSYG